MRFLVLLLFGVAALVWSPHAAAEEAPKTAYLSFSPIHFSRPIGEITGEMKLTPHTSAALVIGAGAIGGQAYWKGGYQLLYYPFGNFENGLQLGLESSYAGFAGGLPSGVVVGPVNALTFSPLIGWKWTHASGFTMSSQAGFSYAPSAQGERRFAALYNLNVGWSF
jgi:hypothetical protein